MSNPVFDDSTSGTFPTAHKRLGSEPAPAATDAKQVPARHPLRDAIVEGAIAAEKSIGRHEETDEQAKQAFLLRLAYTIGGTIVIIIGILLLPLPGPGWIVIALGFSILPFQWSKRVVREIRRRIPGVPEDEPVPLSTWIIGGVLLVGMTTIGLVWGDDITAWAKGLL